MAQVRTHLPIHVTDTERATATLDARSAHASGAWRSRSRRRAAAAGSAARAVTLRVARDHDVPGISALITRFAAEGVMLPRSFESIALTLDDFVVAADDHGRVLGCGALREYSPSLAEIASLAVAPEAHGAGIGSAIVRELEALARLRGVAELFALTLSPAFFEGLGYVVVERTRYPEKTRRDCASCARRHACREICVRRSLADAAYDVAV